MELPEPAEELSQTTSDRFSYSFRNQGLIKYAFLEDTLATCIYLFLRRVHYHFFFSKPTISSNFELTEMTKKLRQTSLLLKGDHISKRLELIQELSQLRQEKKGKNRKNHLLLLSVTASMATRRERDKATTIVAVVVKECPLSSKLPLKSSN